MNELKIITLNIRGAQCSLDNQYLSNFLNNNDVDIACLQEVGISIHEFQNEKYLKILNISKRSNNGTAVLIKRDLNYVNHSTDQNNRIIRIELEKLIVTNVYGYPTDRKYLTRKKYTLFNDDLAKFLKNKKPTILLGDFNATIYRGSSGWFSEVLKELVVGLDFIDSFKYLHPNVDTPTFVSRTGTSHIDRIFFPKESISDLLEIKIKYYEHSDHKVVIAKFRYGTIRPKNHTSPFWKLNSSILSDPEFKINVERLIEDSLKRKPISLHYYEWWKASFKKEFKILTVRFLKLKKKKNSIMKITLTLSLINTPKISKLAETKYSKRSILNLNRQKKKNLKKNLHVWASEENFRT